jgi:DNA-binding NarL/FixJ family response regulator
LAHHIVLVDDHEVVRQGLAELINSQDRYRVVGQAATASEALDVVEQTVPHLVVVDLILGDGPDGIQLTKGIKANHPFTPVLILSGRDESLFAERALLAGASGYLMKDIAAEQMFDAMDSAIAGQIWLSKAMRAQLLPPGLSSRVDRSAVTDPADQAILGELRRGNLTGYGLSRALGRPLGEVERGLDRVGEQLGLPSRAALFLFAQQTG